MMSDLEAKLAAIRERRAGLIHLPPWWANIHSQVFSDDNREGQGHAVAECLDDASADFIAHAPDDIDTLLHVYEATRDELNGLYVRFNGVCDALNVECMNHDDTKAELAAALATHNEPNK